MVEKAGVQDGQVIPVALVGATGYAGECGAVLAGHLAFR